MKGRVAEPSEAIAAVLATASALNWIPAVGVMRNFSSVKAAPPAAKMTGAEAPLVNIVIPFA